jgi:hypothetical protein
MTEESGKSRPSGWEDARWSDSRAGVGQSASDAREGAGPPGGSALDRFLGGSPLAVLVRLLAFSLVVGAFLMWLDIRPGEIFHAVERLIRHAWMMGFDAVRAVVDYIIAGAIFVVPIWLLLRLMSYRR